MRKTASEKYIISFVKEEDFDEISNDNANQYNYNYTEKSKYKLSTIIGIKVSIGENLLNSAVIGSTGGASGIFENSTIIEEDRILVCCSDDIFCLSIPDLTLLWKTNADRITCFEIFKCNNSYIIHGEINISRIDEDGKLLWQESGADIFTTYEGKDNFVVTETYIFALDWENNEYKFDFDGNLLKVEAKDQIYNWVTIGFTQKVDKVSELFYYDKMNNEFFSILATDYLLFDENMNVQKDINTSYSDNSLQFLKDKFLRIENKDKSIIPLPRLEKNENGNDIDCVSQKINQFLISNSINIETASIWKTEENITISIKMNEKVKKSWWKIWK